MKISSIDLFNTIRKSIVEIENDLIQANNTGIFFAPELHIAFCLGSDISKNRNRIFGTSELIWDREQNIGGGGPSDIIFRDKQRNESIEMVIELKLRDTFDAYKADIEKLIRIPSIANKYFCVLLDSFTDKNDDRLLRLEIAFKEKIVSIGHFTFPTWNDWYSSQIFCNLNLYQVN